MANYHISQKIENQNITSNEKIKEKIELLEESYKYCIMNGIKQTVGNYKIEPPGIFIGRGNHPNLGKIKK